MFRESTVGLRTTGLKEAQRAFLKFHSAIKQGRREPFKKAGDKAVSLIHLRTTGGRDVNNRKFSNYSVSYALLKGTSFVDLEVSFKMLGAVSWQAFAKRCRIFVKKKNHQGGIDTYNLAIVHNCGGWSGRGKGFKQKKREFMGLTKNETRIIIKLIRKFWEDYAKSLGF